MQRQELIHLLSHLRQLPKETEWVEFKANRAVHREIGEYISALSNSARLCGEQAGYLIFGVDDERHDVLGTSFDPRKAKEGNEELENWLTHLLNPRIDFRIYSVTIEEKHAVIFKIDPAGNIPVKFSGTAYVRVGSYKKKLDDHPEKARKIWAAKSGYDWSAQICDSATIEHLDLRAIEKARLEYKKRRDNLSNIDSWDDLTFLNKAKITVDGKITRAAILLLGKEEAAHFLFPSPAQISWFLRDERNDSKDFEHFGPPFILTVDKVLSKIRNLKMRFLPPNALFPEETMQYASAVIREALHNCIAHQDYELNCRVNVVERPDEILFQNAGSFIPGSVEAVIQQDAPPKLYRNSFLAQAMVNLRMIETEGGGIKEMFKIQRERFFPLPTYELDNPEEVKVRISGKIIDENYTQILMTKTELDLSTVILLDKIQKKRNVTREEHQFLKQRMLVEGRYPKLFVASAVAAMTGDKAAYIKNRSFDKQYYKDMIKKFLKQYKQATRREIETLLLEKLPQVLDLKQKAKKISNVLSEMSKKDKSIENKGSKRRPLWVLRD